MNFKRLFQNIGYNMHFSSEGRGKFCKKHKVFHHIGEEVRLPTMLLPLYPKLVSFHNNVEIASGVRFVVHDAIHEVINRDPRVQGEVKENIGCIEIMDNVFIGAGTTILPGVKIGPNAIVGAQSVITKDVPPNSICVGAPARQVGVYDEYVQKRLQAQENSEEKEPLEKRIEQYWVEFHQKRDQ